jgi:1-aminocyclopropane-1-carboxylate deaminase/D-cysteine desulfhydrase-like pyridoxal-dependent ACC family enzyme
MAGFIVTARQGAASEARLFLHTGGTPALFAYGDDVVAGNGD